MPSDAYSPEGNPGHIANILVSFNNLSETCLYRFNVASISSSKVLTSPGSVLCQVTYTQTISSEVGIILSKSFMIKLKTLIISKINKWT